VRLRAVIAVACTFAVGAAAPCADAAAGWTIRALPAVGGSVSRAFAVNERGQAAGSAETSTGATHAVRWSVAGKATDLRTLGGSRSSADDVNDLGRVTGTAATAAGVTHAFLYSEGRMRNLGTLGGLNSYGHAINDAGVVAGFSEGAGGTGRAFSWTSARGMRDLGGPVGLSFALAINAFGTIVGSTAGPAPGGSEPVAWRGAAPFPLGLPSPFTYGFAYGVSFTGVAAGSLETDSGADGFVWRNGRIVDIGRLGDFPFTRALGVNSAGEVAGVAFQSLGGATRAVLWRAGTAADLNTVLPAGSPWTLWAANDINDLGQIAGYGLDGDAIRGFVLTPPLRDQAGNLIAFARALEPGSTAFERRAVAALNGVLRGRRGCPGLTGLVRAAARERKLGAVRRSALDVRVRALAANADCG
jgi:probable HAF family extracellular repeat protein